MNNEAMSLIAKKMALLGIDIYWYRNSTKYASTYIVLDRCADDLKKIQDLFSQVWKRDPKMDDEQFMKTLSERYGDKGPKITSKSPWCDMMIAEKKERDESKCKCLSNDDSVPEGLRREV